MEPRCQKENCPYHATSQIRERTLDGSWNHLQPFCELCSDELEDRKAEVDGETTETRLQRSLTEYLRAAQNPETATTVLTDITTEVTSNTANGDKQTLKAVLQTMAKYLLHPSVRYPSFVHQIPEPSSPLYAPPLLPKWRRFHLSPQPLSFRRHFLAARDSLAHHMLVVELNCPPNAPSLLQE